MIEAGKERGFTTLAEVSSVLELKEHHAVLLMDHIDGVGDSEEDPRNFVQAVAYALGLDHNNPADAELCTKLALAHLFGDCFRR